MHHTMPDYNLLKVFGCLTYATILKNGRIKFDSRSRKCTFLRYKQGFKGAVLFDLHSHQLLLSQNTIFLNHISIS